jgi:hypothetical protein
MPALGPIAVAPRVNIELFLIPTARIGSANSGVLVLKDCSSECVFGVVFLLCTCIHI